METAYVGLGANLGDRQTTLAEARRELDAHAAVQVTASSPLYETSPVGGPTGQPAYLNAVLQLQSELGSLELLRLGLSIERRYGRRRREPSGPRTLDIDLLFYGTETGERPELTLPHPRLHQRRFVLTPLAEIAPGLVHPRLGLSVAELLERLPEDEKVRAVRLRW